jgi:NADPH2:quinone reductase
MKAIVLDRAGSLDYLRLGEMPQPEPGFGEIRVKVYAVGLNPVDYKVVESGHPDWEFPFIPGLDVAGVVDGLGEGVTAWKTGDPVYYHGNLSRPGGYADWAVITAHTVAPSPWRLSFVEAAALPCAGFTAYQALYRKMHIKAGQTILVEGGAGGAGGFAVQLAHHTGLTVITTCRTENVDYVSSLGADYLIDYTKGDKYQEIMEITGGRGVDNILDTISGESATQNLQLLAFNGSIASLVGLPDSKAVVPFERAVSIHEIALGGAYLSKDRIAQEDLGLIAREFGELASQGIVKPGISEVISLEQVPESLKRLKNRKVLRGKIVARLVS